MTLTIDLPDDIYEVGQTEAEQQGSTAKERIERISIKTHELRVKYPLKPARED